MSIHSSKPRVLISVLLAAVLTFAVSSPASAASYTWWNASTPAGTTKYEPSGSTSKQRSGVTAESAAGDAAAVTVWLGAYQSTSNGIATVSGPAGYETTKAKWVDWIRGGTDSAPFTITITRGGIGAMSATRGDESASFSASAEIENAHIWTEESEGDIALFIERDGYRAEARATWEKYEKSGVSVRFDTPDGPVQAHAIPEFGIASEELQRNGLIRIADGLFVSDPGSNTDDVDVKTASGNLTVFTFAPPVG